MSLAGGWWTRAVVQCCIRDTEPALDAKPPCWASFTLTSPISRGVARRFIPSGCAPNRRHVIRQAASSIRARVDVRQHVEDDRRRCGARPGRDQDPTPCASLYQTHAANRGSLQMHADCRPPLRVCTVVYLPICQLVSCPSHLRHGRPDVFPFFPSSTWRARQAPAYNTADLTDSDLPVLDRPARHLCPTLIVQHTRNLPGSSTS